MSGGDVLKEVVRYLQDAISEEKSFDQFVRRLDIYARNDYKGESYEFEMKETINKIKNIKLRLIKTEKFAKNMTKGHKRQSNSFIEVVIGSLVKEGNLDNAKQEAKDLLENDKKFRSERTYYRHKAELKKLNIELS